MSIILDRSQVLEIYSEAHEREWVIPSFNAENLTTVEAILKLYIRYGKLKNIK